MPRISPIAATGIAAWLMKLSGRTTGPSRRSEQKSSTRFSLSSGRSASPCFATGDWTRTRIACSSPARSPICSWLVARCCGRARRSEAQQKNFAAYSYGRNRQKAPRVPRQKSIRSASSRRKPEAPPTRPLPRDSLRLKVVATREIPITQYNTFPYAK